MRTVNILLRLKHFHPKCLMTLLLISCMGMFPQWAFGGNTGKISGTVKSDKGEPLPGVNVVIEGTTLGAATDLNGNYFILNVPPGVYSVKASMVGFQTVIQRNIRVEVDRTIFLDFVLKETAVEIGAVEVEAKREVIKRDVSSTQYTFDKTEAQVMPVNTIQDVIRFQPGVSISGDNITIRGGGSDQVNFLLNGISLKDELFNRPYMALNITNIAEIQVLTGGFNAEYGDIRSGLVQVVTKEGGERYNLSLDYKILPYRQKYQGPDIFSTGYRDYLLYASEDISMDSAEIARMFPYESRIWSGWPTVVKSWLSDNDPGNDLTPRQARQLWKWQYRSLPYSKKPDQYLDATLSGPLPLSFLPGDLGDPFKKISFVLSHRLSYEMFALPSVRDHFSDRNTQLEITTKLIPDVKLTATGLWGHEYGIGYTELQGYLDVARGGGSPYSNAIVPTADLYTSLYGIKWTHFLSSNTFYEAQFSYMKREYEIDHGPVRDTTKIYEIPADWYILPWDLTVKGYWDNRTGQYVKKDTVFKQGDSLWVPSHWYDEAPQGWVTPGPATPSVDGRNNLDAATPAQDFSNGDIFRFKFDFSSQVHPQHLLKAGVEFHYDRFHRRYKETNWVGFQKIEYDEYPRRGALYVQDKLELEGMIANLGVRFDYFDAHGEILSPNDAFARVFGTGVNFYDSLSVIERAPSRKFLKISPRVGVAFPISVTSKIYYNYGHFYSLPPTQYVFGYVNHRSGYLEQMGNPNLEPPRTISYEVGFEQSIADEFLLRLSLYYKDVDNQIGRVSYQNIDNTVVYNTFANTNYQDIVGLEVRLTKTYGKFFSGWIQTEFIGSKGGNVGLQTIFQPNDIRVPQFYRPAEPGVYLWNWTPSFLANIDFHTPDDWGPEILGTKLLGGWRFNIIQSWSEGARYTWNPRNDPRVVDNLKWVNSYRTDIKLSKTVKILDRILATLYLDIRNLFPRKVLNPGALHGPGDNPDSEQYQYFDSLIPGEDRIGDYEAEHIKYPKETPGWTIFYDPNGIQTIYFGLRVDI